MRGFILLLVFCLVAPAWGQGFTCGFSESAEADAMSTTSRDEDYWSGTIRPLILFGTFKGVVGDALTNLQDRDGTTNQSMADFLNVEHKGSLAHYFREMSYELLTLEPPEGGIDLKWYESNHADLAGYGITAGSCTRGIWGDAIEQFVGKCSTTPTKRLISASLT